MLSPRGLLGPIAAVLALALLGSGSASAHEFHSEVAPATLKGEQVGTHVFENTSNESKIICGQALLEGKMSATQVAQFTVAAYYAECTFGKTVVFVTLNGCEYEFFGETNLSGEAELKIACPPGKQMEIQVGSLCTAKITSSTVWGVGYVNEGSGTGRDFKVSLKIREVFYEKTGLFCASVFGSGKDMRFTGTFTVKGYEFETQRGIWV
jgi:hypothetical protein